MLHRRHLLRSLAILAVVAAATSIMAVVTIRLVVSSSNVAYADLSSDLELAARVDRGIRRLTDASRTYIAHPDDLQRVRIARIQRELEPDVDRLTARAHALRVPTALQIDTNIDRFLGTLALTVAERSTLDTFEAMVNTWRPITRLDIDAFTTHSRSHGQALLASANGLSGRATLGIVVLAFFMLVTACAAASRVWRSPSNKPWSREVPRS